jgi:hypothetical protein
MLRCAVLRDSGRQPRHGNGSFLLSVVTFLILKPITNHDLTELFIARQ